MRNSHCCLHPSLLKINFRCYGYDRPEGTHVVLMVKINAGALTLLLNRHGSKFIFLLSSLFYF